MSSEATKPRFFRQKRPRSQVFTTLLLSFLSMLLIPAVLLAINLFRYQTILRDETLRYQHSLLEQVQKSVDERLENIRLIALDIATDTTINQYVESRTMQGVELYIQNSRIVALLQDSQAVYRSVKTVLLYTMHYERVLSPSTVYSGPLEDYELEEDAVLSQELVSWFDQTRLYCKFVQLNTRDGSRRALFLLQSIPLWSTGRDAAGVVAIQIDADDLLRNVQDIEGLQDGLVCLVDETGSVLAYKGDAALLDMIGAIPAEDSGWQNTGPAAGYMVNRVGSALNGWQYLSIQPQAGYRARMREVFQHQMLLVLLSGSLGILAAWLLSRRNYSPLEKVMERMQRNHLLGRRALEENEYDFIENAFGALHSSMATLQDTLVQEVPRIQENMLFQLMTGTVTDYEAYRRGMTELGFLTPYPGWLVAVVEIASCTTERAEEREMFRLLLRRRAANALPGNITCGAVDLQQNQLALLLNGPEDALEPAAAAALQQLLDYARTELQLILTVCVSEVTTRLESVSDAYYAACRLRDRCRAAERTGLVRARDHREQDKVCTCPEAVRTRLTSLAATGNLEQALDCFESGCRASLAQHNPDLYTARSFYITLTDAVLQGMPLQSERFAQFWAEHNPIPALMNGNTLNELHALTRQFITDACLLVRQGRKSHVESMCAAVLQYIGENYADSSLSLSAVADHFSITPNYLSALLKDYAGETFLNYLTRTRVAAAKRLLKKTNRPVGEIAASVGYANANSLIRNYKKLEHVTPGEYRDSIRDQK